MTAIQGPGKTLRNWYRWSLVGSVALAIAAATLPLKIVVIERKIGEVIIDRLFARHTR